MSAPDWLAQASHGKFSATGVTTVTAPSSVFAADMDVFFSDFAQVAILTHLGTDYSVNVDFTDAYKSVSPATGEIETSAPTAEYETAEYPAPVHGDTLLVGTVLYRIIGIQPAEDSLSTLLILSRD